MDPSPQHDAAPAAPALFTRLPPALVAHLFSAWFNSSEAMRLLSVCRRWSLSGTDRRLLFGMIARTAEEQTVDPAFYREPRKELHQPEPSNLQPEQSASSPEPAFPDPDLAVPPPLLLPWRQRHMRRVQHVCVRLSTAEAGSAISDDPHADIPSFARLPSPSAAPPSFTLQSHREFALRWTERRMMSRLDVTVRMHAAVDQQPPAPGNHAQLSAPSDEGHAQQQRLWSMLACAFESCSAPLSVTFVSADQPQRLTPIIALTSRWMPDECDAPASSPPLPAPSASTASSASSLSSSSSSSDPAVHRGPLSLRLHSLIFRTRQTDFIYSVISYLRQTTGSEDYRIFADPRLSAAHRQWYAEAARDTGQAWAQGWTQAQIDGVHARNLLVPLNVLFFHSDDPMLPAGLPPLIVDLMQTSSSGLSDPVVARYSLHSLFIQVAHTVSISQVIEPLMQRVVRPRELYLFGLKLGMESDMQPCDGVRCLVLRGRSINSFGDPHPLPFSVAVRLLSNGFRRVQRIELIDYSFYGPAALRVWCPEATHVRLERCSFDDDDGFIDLQAHAQSLWTADATPRMAMTVRPTTLGLFCRRLYRDNRGFPLIFGAGTLFFFLPLLLVDAFMAWLFPRAPHACYARFFNLVLIEWCLIYCFIKTFVFPGTWGLPRAPTPYQPPPTRVLRLLGFGFPWCAWINALVALPPWPCHPVQAVVCMSSIKMLMSTLTGANAANWDRVQRARKDLAAFVSYFVRLTIASSMQLAFFLPFQHSITALWRFILVLTSSALHLRFVPAFTPFDVHPLAERMFVDSQRCIDARDPIPIALPRPIPSLLKQILVVCTDAEPISWIRSWWDGSAWMQWAGRFLSAVPAILSLALILFALQVSVRRLRRSIRTRWLHLQCLAEPLLVADGLLWW